MYIIRQLSLIESFSEVSTTSIHHFVIHILTGECFTFISFLKIDFV